MIEKTFEKLGRGALIGYITCGDPDPSTSIEIAKFVSERVDILELGIPFSDPVADGVTIQTASDRALKSGTTPDFCFELASQIDTPKVFLTYFNIVLQRGIEKFMSDCKKSGVSGIIVPDLPIEEAGELIKSARKHSIDTIFLIAPTTPDERIKKIVKETRGFVYVVSRLGVTGARKDLQESTKFLIDRVCRQTKRKIPIAVGFGISTPQHVHDVISAGADGAIVGSAIVDIIAKNLGNKERMLEELDVFLEDLRSGCEK
ncbi:MAG: tryptophan synthase subunit alpha [Candidatus Syntropharchaeia archaeon]